jgi:hypothetical protein
MVKDGGDHSFDTPIGEPAPCAFNVAHKGFRPGELAAGLQR